MNIRKISWTLICFIPAILFCIIPFAQSASITVDVNPDQEFEKVIRDTNDRIPVLGNVILGLTSSVYLTAFDGAGVWDPYAIPSDSVPAMVDYANDLGMSYCRYPGNLPVSF